MGFNGRPTVTAGRDPLFKRGSPAAPLPNLNGWTMPKGYKGAQPLSEVQAFSLDNLRAQTKLKAELVWLNARSGGRKDLHSARKAEIEAELAALNASITARRRGVVSTA